MRKTESVTTPKSCKMLIKNKHLAELETTKKSVTEIVTATKRTRKVLQNGPPSRPNLRGGGLHRLKAVGGPKQTVLELKAQALMQ